MYFVCIRECLFGSECLFGTVRWKQTGGLRKGAAEAAVDDLEGEHRCEDIGVRGAEVLAMIQLQLISSARDSQ